GNPGGAPLDDQLAGSVGFDVSKIVDTIAFPKYTFAIDESDVSLLMINWTDDPKFITSIEYCAARAAGSAVFPVTATTDSVKSAAAFAGLAKQSAARHAAIPTPNFHFITDSLQGLRLQPGLDTTK